MSKFVKVRTELRDLSLIKRALDDLKLIDKSHLGGTIARSSRLEVCAKFN